MDNEVSAKDWIRAVARYMDLSPSALAFNAGLAPSTVTRYLNDTTNTLTVQQRTLNRIAEHSGIPVMYMPDALTKNVGLSDIYPYKQDDIDLSPWMHEAAKFIGKQEDVELWVVYTRVLDMSGLLPNDLIAVSKAKRPRSGDVVVAINAGSHLLRIYEPPYLMTHSAKLGIKRPLLIDEQTTSVASTCVNVVRHRK